MKDNFSFESDKYSKFRPRYPAEFFDFLNAVTPMLEIRELWSFKRLIGYLRTWSAVRHFVNQKGHNPVDDLQNQLEPIWPAYQTKDVNFPVLLRLGRL